MNTIRSFDQSSTLDEYYGLLKNPVVDSERARGILHQLTQEDSKGEQPTDPKAIMFLEGLVYQEPEGDADNPINKKLMEEGAQHRIITATREEVERTMQSVEKFYTNLGRRPNISSVDDALSRIACERFNPESALLGALEQWNGIGGMAFTAKEKTAMGNDGLAWFLDNIERIYGDAPIMRTFAQRFADKRYGKLVTRGNKDLVRDLDVLSHGFNGVFKNSGSPIDDAIEISRKAIRVVVYPGYSKADSEDRN